MSLLYIKTFDVQASVMLLGVLQWFSLILLCVSVIQLLAASTKLYLQMSYIIVLEVTAWIRDCMRDTSLA